MYTNGFKIPDVLTALTGRVGFLQPTQSSFTTALTSANTASASGRYFQDFHPVCSPAILKDIQEDPGISDANFNSFLQRLQQSSILKALNGVFNKRELLERKLLFERFGRQDYLTVNNSKFVGVRIQPARDFHKTIQIERVILHFNQAVTFNLYLFHDAVKAPIWVQSVSVNANDQTEITLSSPYINYAETQKSGCYYLGYFQDDLGSAQAINEMVEQFNVTYNFGLQMTELNRVPGQYDIDRNLVSYTVMTHGINLQVMAFRDHTQMIVNNAGLFDELIGLQVAADVIEQIQNSPRTNNSQLITKEQSARLYNDLNLSMSTQELPYSTGLKNKIQREILRVRNEIFPRHKLESVDHDTDCYDIYGVPLNTFNY